MSLADKTVSLESVDHQVYAVDSTLAYKIKAMGRLPSNLKVLHKATTIVALVYYYYLSFDAPVQFSSLQVSFSFFNRLFIVMKPY